MARALLLFSGGLDSTLAVKLLEEQGVDVTALCFVSNFFNAEKAKEMAKNLGFKLRIEDISKDELDLVKNPPNGYGKNMNPCIDCHAMMIKKAGKIAKAENYDLVATGEVLGQRPFSQNRLALAQVEKIAGIEVLRPLCAKNLEETSYEKKGLVKRDLLKSIKGRQREEQIKLAKHYGIENFPSPSGGCLLTDPEYSARLMKMMGYWPDCSINEVALLSYGRIIWLENISNKKILMVVGRNHNDNENLKKLAKKDDIMVELKEINGPLTLLRGRASENLDFGKEVEIEVPKIIKMSKYNLAEPKGQAQIMQVVTELTAYYSVKARSKKVKLIFKYVL